MRLVPIVEINQGYTKFGLPEREGLSARIKNPVLHARYWMDQGASSVFFKDCDGILAGKPQYNRFLEYLDGTVNKTVYYCGGIRDLRSVRIFENRKYTKIVSATALVENKKFLRNILVNNMGPVALWIDSVDGFIYTRNATHKVGKRTIDVVRSLPEHGIDEIFFCSRSEQGPLKHPDHDMIANILDLGCADLYVADNFSTKQDFQNLLQYKSSGLAGVAVNESLYDGTLSSIEIRSFFQTENINF